MKDCSIVSMMSIDLSDDKNLKKTKNVDLSFATRHVLTEAKASEAKEME